jgi:hypothetical protein
MVHDGPLVKWSTIALASFDTYFPNKLHFVIRLRKLTKIVLRVNSFQTSFDKMRFN